MAGQAHATLLSNEEREATTLVETADTCLPVCCLLSIVLVTHATHWTVAEICLERDKTQFTFIFEIHIYNQSRTHLIRYLPLPHLKRRLFQLQVPLPLFRPLRPKTRQEEHRGVAVSGSKLRACEANGD
ncbi:hypothetical protein BDZ85DRAFT_269356 [Elsinoe ampelina]|uniref:Uncharacterized protein n=1 Tax=Elsinoe ampelina TaxID=302913 RepID=A0A6A6FZX5_9PEZI|nr:hypothetical protein BDZ85DRAFT_269356 [Elsinoe ampelina]